MDDPLATWVKTLIRDFCAGPENSLRNASAERAWDEPLIGFARGDDPLWQAYKTHVGPAHWTPAEAFTLTFPGERAAAGELSVIAWILPQTEQTKADNRAETRYPAERWARSRIFGEEFNSKLRQHMAETLSAAGHLAAAPHLSPVWARVDSAQFVYASTWSERHAAYAAGLGTFGLCDGLITSAGKAMRVGSVVARLALPVTPRPYTHHRAYCVFFADGSCGECIARCPAGALSVAGHDKRKCEAYLSGTRPYVRAQFGFEGYGCGLCQTGVPCESEIPWAVRSRETPASHARAD
jgi:epoxyqueuosine reductase QueG